MPAAVVPAPGWVRVPVPVQEAVRAEKAVWVRALEPGPERVLEPGRAEEPAQAPELARAPGAVEVEALASERAWAAAVGAELAEWARTAPGSSRPARSPPGRRRGRTLQSST